MNILAIDTASGTQSVAILESERLRAIVGVRKERARSERVLRLVLRALELAELSPRDLFAVAVSRGPGSLTGLRVGLGTARGIAVGAGVPLLGVSTLQALAIGAGAGAAVLSLVDAGRGEVYAGLYRPGFPPEPAWEERLAPPAEIALAAPGFELRIAGSGALRYRHLFPQALFPADGGEEMVAAGVGRIAAARLAQGGAGVVEGETGPGGLLDPRPRYIYRGRPAAAEG